jgi:hypothetical protein
MHPDPSEIQKLTERVDKLEKTVSDLVGRYIFWMIALGAVLLYLVAFTAGLKH